MKLYHQATAVAWGARRRDYQIGSIADRRETYRRECHTRAIAAMPIVRTMPRTSTR